MGAGVSAELSRVAGQEYRNTASQFIPVRPGRAVVTPAGALPARFVIHGITMGRKGGTWISPSRDLVNEIMDSCFYNADTLSLRSIAFPLLGTGTGRLSPEVCLDTMFLFLARKLSQGVTSIRDVRIVLYPLSQKQRQHPGSWIHR